MFILCLIEVYSNLQRNFAEINRQKRQLKTILNVHLVLAYLINFRKYDVVFLHQRNCLLRP